MNPTFHPATISSLAIVLALSGQAFAAAGSSGEDIAAAIKADVRDIVTGINTHDVHLATAHDAPDLIGMDNGQPNTVGLAADATGFKQAFASDPTWHVSMLQESVDVAASGDMAVYRSVYNQDGTQASIPVTQKVNFVSGWSRHDGKWTMDWYVVSEIEKPHKK